MKPSIFDMINSAPEGTLELCIDLMAGETVSKAIENQEKMGQLRACQAQQLPQYGTTNREDWESLGFNFGENVDELFVAVTMPDGWKFERTDHSMHSNLLDEQGRIRAKMFYKAAVYDRRADIQLQRRFSINSFRDNDEPNSTVRVSVEDNSTTPPTRLLTNTIDVQDIRERESARDTLYKETTQWLKDKYPDWQNALAYW